MTIPLCGQSSSIDDEEQSSLAWTSIGDSRMTVRSRGPSRHDVYW